MRLQGILFFLIMLSAMAFAQAAPNTTQNDSGPGGKDVIIETQNQTIPVPTGCTLGFNDTINVRALDNQLRPVEGAQVTVNYQLDKTTGKGRVTSPPRMTGKDGNASFQIRNLETQAAHLDCNVQINLSIGGKNYSRTITAQNHPLINDFKLDLHQMLVQVIDENGQRITNATVTVNNNDKGTEGGYAEFRVPAGTVRVFASYGGGKTEHITKINNDTLVTIQLRFYSLTVRVTDEKENPLAASVLLDEMRYDLNESGTLHIPRLPEGLHTARIEYGGMRITRDLDLTMDNEYGIVFDMAPPVIKKVTAVQNPDHVKVTIVAEDEGRFASGDSVDYITVTYETVEGKKERAVVYQNKPHEYVAQIPLSAVSQEAVFTAEVRDGAGNGATITGRHLLEGAPDGPGDPGGEEEPDSTDTVQPPPVNDGPPLFHIIGGILILVIVFYAVYRLKFKKDES